MAEWVDIEFVCEDCDASLLHSPKIPAAYVVVGSIPEENNGWSIGDRFYVSAAAASMTETCPRCESDSWRLSGLVVKEQFSGSKFLKNVLINAVIPYNGEDPKTISKLHFEEKGLSTSTILNLIIDLNITHSPRPVDAPSSVRIMSGTADVEQFYQALKEIQSEKERKQVEITERAGVHCFLCYTLFAPGFLLLEAGVSGVFNHSSYCSQRCMDVVEADCEKLCRSCGKAYEEPPVPTDEYLARRFKRRDWFVDGFCQELCLKNGTSDKFAGPTFNPNLVDAECPLGHALRVPAEFLEQSERLWIFCVVCRRRLTFQEEDQEQSEEEDSGGCEEEEPSKVIADCDCGKKYRIPTKHSGKRIRCKSCQGSFVVPFPNQPNSPE